MLLLLTIRPNHGDNSDQDPFHQMWLAASELDIFLRSQNRMLLYDEADQVLEFIPFLPTWRTQLPVSHPWLRTRWRAWRTQKRIISIRTLAV